MLSLQNLGAEFAKSRSRIWQMPSCLLSVQNLWTSIVKWCLIDFSKNSQKFMTIWYRGMSVKMSPYRQNWFIRQFTLAMVQRKLCTFNKFILRSKKKVQGPCYMYCSQTVKSITWPGKKFRLGSKRHQNIMFFNWF